MILTKEEIMDNHRSASLGISTKDEELDLPSLYWMPKLHKYSLKQRYIFISLDNSANGTRYIAMCCEFVGGLGVFASLTVSIDNKALHVALTLNYQYAGLVFKV
jgi:hypothetical protein